MMVRPHSQKQQNTEGIMETVVLQYSPHHRSAMAQQFHTYTIQSYWRELLVALVALIVSIVGTQVVLTNNDTSLLLVHFGNTKILALVLVVLLLLLIAVFIGHLALRQQWIIWDEETDEALFQAARDGHVKTCRLLFQRLSARAKQKYYGSCNDWYSSMKNSPLHEAVRNEHFPVVQLLIQELHFNVNQYDKFRNTPLFYAVTCASAAEEMTCFLLQHGADVNRGGRYGPLYEVVSSHGNNAVVTLLLQHGADPNLNRKSATEEAFNFELNDTPRCTDEAMDHGDLQVLSILLLHGAHVGHFHTASSRTTGTALNRLLLNEKKSLQTKLDICTVLVHRANDVDNSSSSNSKDQTRAAAAAITMLLQHSLEMSITAYHKMSCEILIQAGVNASLAMHGAIQEQNTYVCQLLLESGVDPFQQDCNCSVSSSSSSSSSPLEAAARLENTDILHLFLMHWNEKFGSSSSSNDGKNGRNNNGMYPIHVLASYNHVSLQAIQLVIEGGGQEGNSQDQNANNTNNALMAVDDTHGLYPFHFAVMSDVNLNVLYCILKHYPDALVSPQQQQQQQQQKQFVGRQGEDAFLG